MEKKNINLIESIDDIKKPYAIGKEFYKENKKNNDSGIEISEDLKNDFLILKYDDKDQTNIKEVWILFDNKVKKDDVQNIIPRLRKYYSAFQYRVKLYKVTDNELIKNLQKFGEEGVTSILKKEDNETLSKVNEILEYAVKNGVSDIHLEISENSSKIRMRINGDLVPYGPSLFKEKGESYARMIYQVFTSRKGGKSATSFNPAITQDGVFEDSIDNKRIRVRIATMPIFPRGFQMVCRILVDDTSNEVAMLDSLGYSYKEINDIARMNSRAEGCIIVAGVTGSGKSTTLKNLIERKIIENEHKIKVITVEDPPEYTIRGAQQVPITRESTKGGEDNGKDAYLKTMQAAVRSDPDVIMIGEVRDSLSANTLRSATESGHTVFATIHAASIFNIIGRLKNFELETEVITAPNFISGLIYQKLVKKLCSHCSIGFKDGKIPLQNNYQDIIMEMFNELSNKDIDLALLSKLEENGDYETNLVRKLQDKGYINSREAKRIMDTYREINNEDKNNELLYRIESICDKTDLKYIRFKGTGCSHCKGSGYVGRMVCAETLVPDRKILEILSEDDLPAAENYWRMALNGRTAFDDSIEKMKNGKVDPLDIERTFNEIGKK